MDCRSQAEHRLFEVLGPGQRRQIAIQDILKLLDITGGQMEQCAVPGGGGGGGDRVDHIGGGWPV